MSRKMSGGDVLQELRVDRLVHKPRPKSTAMVETGRMQRDPDFVYVNPGFVGTHNVRRQEPRLSVAPPTSVIREQYWACSRWTAGQRYMAIAVAVLFGTVIGLAITIILNDGDTDIVSGIFLARQAPG